MPSRHPEAGRALTWFLGALSAVLVITLGAVVAAFLWWPFSWNPFHEQIVDRTGPSVLHSLSNLSEYHAATAYYETLVDIEKGHTYVPDWVTGDRVLYVAKGEVNGIVDFRGLDESRIKISEDRLTVSITLPAPTIGKPALDIEQSRVAFRDQGFVTKFKGSDLEREAQLKAIEQMTTAATGEDNLLARAEDNTRDMLTGLLSALGFTTVTVTFDQA